MKVASLVSLKRIIATEPQALINLKLRFNALASKVNTNESVDSELEGLHARIKELTTQINAHT